MIFFQAVPGRAGQAPASCTVTIRPTAIMAQPMGVAKMIALADLMAFMSQSLKKHPASETS